MSWFRRDRPEQEKLAVPEGGERKVKTEGLWQKCDKCRQIIWKKELETNWNICPKCGNHFRIDAPTRLRLLLDGGEYTEYDRGMISSDPLGFVDSKPYTERLKAARAEMEGRDLVFLIGGHDGLPPGWAARADLLLSLSPMTFPHELARAMLAEQIYRAFATLRGHPYPR